MSLLSRLFGGGAEKPAQAEVHEGFSITPTPAKESNGWRLAALIEKDGQSHTLIRADVFQSKDEAEAASIAKAKQMIDEQGARLFS